MFDKNKCKKCIYHGRVQGMTYCDYSRYYTAAIRRDGKRMVDTRGEDPANCKLYREGEPPKSRSTITII